MKLIDHVSDSEARTLFRLRDRLPQQTVHHQTTSALNDVRANS